MNFSSKQQNWFAKYWPVLLIGSAWLWLFWPMMTGTTVCGFRDSAYLYYPLFKWIDAQWAAGDIPLWNHYDQFGVPVVADGSSSVFYPGKLIFFLRFLSYESRYGIYLAVHVLIAAASCYWFARRLGCKQGGATFAAISYAFGGSVLFQVCNVIYLVGAAWLPAALCCLWLMFRQRSLVSAVAGGFFCALIVLGGDPQLVYNIGLIGLGTVVGTFIRQRIRGRRQGNFSLLLPMLFVRKHVALLFILVFVTFALSAIQMLPVMDWSADSVRSVFRSPRSLYELYGVVNQQYPDGVFQETIEGFLGTPKVGTHLHHVYQFSQPPWTFAELFIPNFSGKPFPTNNRWITSLPGADRMWIPSLYFGCLASILAIFSMRLWGKRRRQVWLTRVGLFFAIGSFGWYGVVWIVGEFVDLSGIRFDLGPQVGGIYWLLVVGLPKYVMFRYPAKLFVIAHLALCLLAGISVGHVNWIVASIRNCIWMIVLSIYAVLLLGTLILPWLSVSWPRVPDDPLFGPFVLVECLFSIQLSLIQAFVVILVAFAFLKMHNCSRWNRRNRAFKIGTVICVISLVDVLAANTWMLAEVSSQTFTNEIERDLSSMTPLQVMAYPAWSKDASSKHRLSEIVFWQREGLFPKHHLEIPIRHEESFTSIVRRLPMHAREGPTAFAFVRYRDGIQPAKVLLARNGFYQIETDDRDVSRHLRVESYNLPDWHVSITDENGHAFKGEILTWRSYLYYIEIPPGRCLVELKYHPKAFYRGAWISGVSWSILVLLVVIHWTRNSRNTLRPVP